MKRKRPGLSFRHFGYGYVRQQGGVNKLIDPAGYRLGIDETRMAATFVITSEDVDRVGDVVVTQGIYLGNFERNPVCPYSHQALIFPVGKWRDPEGNCTIRLEEKRAVGTVYFSQTYSEAATVFALVKEEILNATSIGFNPLVPPVRRDPDERGSAGIEVGLYYPSVDLLEVSIVMVPAQPTATLVRQCLSRGKVDGIKLSPQIRKALKPYADPKRAVLFPGEFPMAKRKMDESSGTSGGYTVAPEHKAMIAKVYHAILGVAEKHKDDAHPDGPHGFFYHPVKRRAYHQHHAEAGAMHLKAVRRDLEEIPDVEEVHQGSDPPASRGMHKGDHGEGEWMEVYPNRDQSWDEYEQEIDEQGGDKEESTDATWAEEEDEIEEEGGHKEESTESTWDEVEEIEEEEGKHKGLTREKARLRKETWYRKLFKSVPLAIRGQLEDCVHRKIPKIAEDHPEFDDKQRIAVAFAMCRERLGKSKKKEMEEEEEETPTPEPSESMPHGAHMLHAILHAIEEHRPHLEPELHKIADEMEESARKHGMKRYPDHGFHKEDEEEESKEDEYEEAEDTAEDEEEAEEAEELLEEYESSPDQRPRKGLTKRMPNKRIYGIAKRMPNKRIYGIAKEAADFLHDHGAADNLTHEQRRDVMYHHHALHSMCRDMSDHATDTVPTDPDAEIPDTHKRLDDRLKNIGTLYFRMTGKRIAP